ncbi:MAG: LemA family protein [bacterium]|nr:LemA family protein [bacterium]MDT8395418.1 LemA family protein [bacterium]
MVGLIILGVIVLAVLWAVAVFNRLVRNKNLVLEGWSGIDVQLKRRYDLIPNLVETIKGYTSHEEGVLTRVVELRNAAGKAQTAAEKAPIETALTGMLRQVFALAEAYPDLKANQNFLDLQGQLAEIEEQIQFSRRYYNGAARDMNILVQSFPSNLIANAFRFPPAEYFEIELATEREAPKVQF